ncbi:coiled-coil domain-containing protein 169-like isoform X2 [Lineus longissimus]|uniref:coiled-coil domain-containing protein 169-like isoform X2 n=1 Tax=Lineus longissimus TaxID=88925 RepID=UPI00315D08D5
MANLQEHDLERLRAELQQEKQMQEMLEQSSTELKMTVDELERRIDNIDEEGNEWKTRFETQLEMNQQLDKQILLLQDKIDMAKKASQDMQGKAQKEIFTKIDFTDVTHQTIRMMEREKGSVQNQLRDIEWRVDQESKAYHKANEERKQYNTEISAAKHTITGLETKYKHSTPRGDGYDEGPKISTRNIPPDQRIIDPRKGPINKTAAVKKLPKLE